jgi:hypothetical protein
MSHKGNHLQCVCHDLQFKLIAKSTNDDHLFIHFEGTPLLGLPVLATSCSPSFLSLLKSFTFITFEFLPLCHNKLQCLVLNIYIV